jgi:hypothetical protein
MPCCGKTRATPTPGLANPPAAGAGTDAGPSSGPAIRETLFEYRGGRVLTVTGQGTGLQYRFVGFGARVFVDARDRASLAAVPHLRQVRT